MSRRTARETAMKLLYQHEIQRDNVDELMDIFLSENPADEKDRLFIMDVVGGTVKNLQNIDDMIEKYARGWKLSRISKVELSILRLSIYEMFHRGDIPHSVSINEAIELAKRFCGEDAGAFVNGILGGVSKCLTEAKT